MPTASTPLSLATSAGAGRLESSERKRWCQICPALVLLMLSVLLDRGWRGREKDATDREDEDVGRGHGELVVVVVPPEPVLFEEEEEGEEGEGWNAVIGGGAGKGGRGGTRGRDSMEEKLSAGGGVGGGIT